MLYVIPSSCLSQHDEFFRQPLCLSPERQPREVEDWSKGRKYSKKHVPVVDDIHRYRDDWIDWWTASQPHWRRMRPWPFAKSGSDGAWEGFPARGQGGIFLAIMATCWWAQAVKSAEEFALFEEAVDDIHWVIQEFVRTSSPPSPPDGPRSPVSASWTRTFSRGDGKRRVKPSQRARDML